MHIFVVALSTRLPKFLDQHDKTSQNSACDTAQLELNRKFPLEY